MPFRRSHLLPQTPKQCKRGMGVGCHSPDFSRQDTETRAAETSGVPQPTGERLAKLNSRLLGPFRLQENNLCLRDRGGNQRGTAAQIKLDRTH